VPRGTFKTLLPPQGWKWVHLVKSAKGGISPKAKLFNRLKMQNKEKQKLKGILSGQRKKLIYLTLFKKDGILSRF